MFVAWRDLRFAKGRFTLMGAVVVLITLLVGLLSGLTAGLAEENTSAVTGLPADHLAFAAPPAGQSVSFTGSTVPAHAWRIWADRPGVTSAEPIGIRTLNAGAGNRTAAVSSFAVRPHSGIAPAGVAPGRVVLSEKAAAELGVAAGDRVRLGGTERTVAAVEGRAAYSHTPVVWTDLSGPATVVALRTDGADLAAADRAAGTRTLTRDDALTAIGSYRAENGSLQLMRGFLFAISALVIGAFFTVWTIQRSPDIAVLKALGASTPYLLRDALGQVVLMLTGGTLLGTGLAAGAGALVRGGDVPFALDGPTVLGPAAVITVLGALGAGLSVRRITAVDPLTALGSAR
ncbi:MULTISPECIES: ABC transporter permease [unclassified Streptomyces]|uniref:ABC transporter permease n=1 Tax=unclassified Streptomyces TaxID=2593676 RepID=UPI00224FA272|nr:MULTISPECIES: ABC transporter permease [unclassified Streptomyces]MCX4987626.1 ABC transporter permease [Streptomyces sp. NBC_00568]MCX5007242.1 ABC transporter permease [Streptomyces sp. NBC_00638]